MGQQRTRGQNEPSDEPAFTSESGGAIASDPGERPIRHKPVSRPATHVATTRLVSSRSAPSVVRASRAVR